MKGARVRVTVSVDKKIVEAQPRFGYRRWDRGIVVVSGPFSSCRKLKPSPSKNNT